MIRTALKISVFPVVLLLASLHPGANAVAAPILVGSIYDSSAGPGLIGLSPSTASAALIGSYGIATTHVMGGIGYDSSTGTLYGSETVSDTLYTIDTQTGGATVIGTFGAGVGFMHALAVNPATGILASSLFCVGSAPRVFVGFEGEAAWGRHPLRTWIGARGASLRCPIFRQAT